MVRCTAASAALKLSWLLASRAPVTALAHRRGQWARVLCPTRIRTLHAHTQTHVHTNAMAALVPTCPRNGAASPCRQVVARVSRPRRGWTLLGGYVVGSFHRRPHPLLRIFHRGAGAPRWTGEAGWCLEVVCARTGNRASSEERAVQSAKPKLSSPLTCRDGSPLVSHARLL